MAVRSNQHPIAIFKGISKISTKLSLRALSSVMFAGALALTGAGCHSYRPLTPQPVAQMPSLNETALDTSGIATVHCSGGVGCQFLALNGVQLLNADTGGHP